MQHVLPLRLSSAARFRGYSELAGSWYLRFFGKRLTLMCLIKAVTWGAVFTGFPSLLQVLAAICSVTEYATVHHQNPSPLWATGAPLKMER